MNPQIEDHLRARGVRYFRGHHDDEYFFFVDFLCGPHAARLKGRLNVHLEACDTEPDAVVMTISPDRYYPLAEADRLRALADRWNAGHPAVEAVVHGSCDPHLVGVLARGRVRSSDPVTLAVQVDDAVTAGITLFGQLAATGLTPAGSAGLRDAG